MLSLEEFKQNLYTFIQPLNVGMMLWKDGIYSSIEGGSILDKLPKAIRTSPYGLVAKAPETVWGYYKNLMGSLLSPVIVAQLDKLRPLPTEEGEVILYARDGSSFTVKLNLKPKSGALNVESSESIEAITKELTILVENLLVNASADAGLSAENVNLEATTNLALDGGDKVSLTSGDSTEITTKTFKVANDNYELIETLEKLLITLEGAKVFTLAGMQSILPGGEPFTLLKAKIQSFKE